MREAGPGLFAADGDRVDAAAAYVVIISLPSHQVGFESKVAWAGDRNWGIRGERPGVVAILRDSARVGIRATRGNIRPSYGIPLFSFPVVADVYGVSGWHVCSPLDLPGHRFDCPWLDFYLARSPSESSGNLLVRRLHQLLVTCGAGQVIEFVRATNFLGSIPCLNHFRQKFQSQAGFAQLVIHPRRVQ